MKFYKLCKYFSVALFFSVVSWIIWLSKLITFLNVIVLLATAITCIFIYGVGEITESIKFIESNILNKELEEETKDKIEIKI